MTMSPPLQEIPNEDINWWMASLEGDWSFGAPLSLDASESGLFNGNFVPPPPRPPFLDDTAKFDGLTTCGMCAWATKNSHLLTSSNPIDTSGEWGFLLVIVIVALSSALIGALVMVIVLKFRRMKAQSSGRSALPCHSGVPERSAREPREHGVIKHGADTIRIPNAPSSCGVWNWLGQRRSSGGTPDPLSQPSSSPAENHYTHMDESYNPELGEALYAELDRESLQSGNPSYQNTAYSACGDVDKEMQVLSSAPSSAYYSDLSATTTIPSAERTYDIVGINNCCPLLEVDDGSGETNAHFDLNILSNSTQRRHLRLSSINECDGRGSGRQPSEFV